MPVETSTENYLISEKSIIEALLEQVVNQSKSTDHNTEAIEKLVDKVDQLISVSFENKKQIEELKEFQDHKYASGFKWKDWGRLGRYLSKEDATEFLALGGESTLNKKRKELGLKNIKIGKEVWYTEESLWRAREIIINQNNVE
ncbi:MAG: hypothetical protein C0602_11570 [Denitrovibrio sp.]|nr:MAG: hypothetical protein C0602_11570 [Denitrovibrio sp.]